VIVSPQSSRGWSGESAISNMRLLVEEELIKNEDYHIDKF